MCLVETDYVLDEIKRQTEKIYVKDEIGGNMKSGT